LCPTGSAGAGARFRNIDSSQQRGSSVKTLLTRLRVKGLHAPGLFLAALAVVVGTTVDARAQGNFGTIRGRLVWGGGDVPPAKNLVDAGAATKDPAVCASSVPIASRELTVDPKSRGIRYGFAYLVRPQGANPDAVKALVAKTPKVEIDQKNCEFMPYVAALHQDQPLVLKSSDPINHNVRFSAFTNAPFNQILPPNGQVEVKLVAERRPIPLACDIHPWMKGYVMVFDHPFFAITGEDGSFEIAGVPAGTHNLVVWQETKGYVTEGLAKGMPVEVKLGGATDVGAIKLVPTVK
jgi:hypothetical protein